MTRYAFSIDLDRCIGCQACVVACKTGNERPPGNNYIQITESVRGQMPQLVGTFLHHRCFHCAEAACVTVCPTGTLAKWNGLTTVTAEKCSGCGYCTDACPYKVPAMVEGRVAKCVACLDLVREGQSPWCAQTCPSQAIKFGERDKLLAEAQVRVATLKTRYPNAQVYGDTQLGGLGLLMVLPDAPAVLGLPANPQTPAALNVWQSMDQPVTFGVSLSSVLFTGLAFIVARREHKRAQAALHTAEESIERPAVPQPEKPIVNEDHAQGHAPAMTVQAKPIPRQDAAKDKGPAADAPPEPASTKVEAMTPSPATGAQPKLAQPAGDQNQGGK
jgi:formate dehydrogenase iron-sulfur subunit